MPLSHPERRFSSFQRHIAQLPTIQHPAITSETGLLDTKPPITPSNHPVHIAQPDPDATIFVPFPSLLLKESYEAIALDQQKSTLPEPAIFIQDQAQESQFPVAHEQMPLDKEQDITEAKTQPYKKLRIVAIALVVILALVAYFIWHQAPVSTPAPIITPSTSTNAAGNANLPTPASTADTTTGNIQVYIVGAVQHPGVYTLPADARVFQLLQAAGGPLPNANLVALNMAAKLQDGQEVYVTVVGEEPPTYVGGVPAPGNTDTSATGTDTPTAKQGQLVNINTASSDELRQQLHLSSKTAQAIVSYRQQHGNFASVNDLLLVVSTSIYDKIKGLVTV